MTTDLSEFESVRRMRGPICWRARAALSDEQSAKLDAALATDRITTSQIHEVLRSWGLEIGKGQIGYHRRGECACNRT